MNHFKNAKRIRCANGIAVPVCPFEPFNNGEYCGNQEFLDNFNEFEAWLSQQPTIHCSPELNGVYPVGEFGDVVWQYKSPFNSKWYEVPKYRIEKHQQMKYPNIERYLSLYYDRIRQFINYIGPKKQEREALKPPAEFNKQITVNSFHAECPACGEKVDVIPADGTIIYKPATHEQNGVEQAEQKVAVPIGLIFKGQQLQLWHLLDYRPRPTWVFAEIMERPTKDITNQLKQMAKRTGLVKIEITNNVKNWYK